MTHGTDANLVYASVCDGISAVSQAWHPLGWRCAWVSEIEPFCNALIQQRWGHRNLGDMLTITENQLAQHEHPDVFVGGTPCQSFSVAGLRKGLDDPRGNLALRFCQLAGVMRTRWVVWENVPGVLSSGKGEDFGSIVRGLAELGYGVVWRVLDAQYYGVAQRRRRVFVVGYLGDWRPAAAVLLEPEGVRWDSAPSREAGAGVAGCIGGGSGKRGWSDDFERSGAFIPSVSPALKRRDFKGPSSDGDGDGAPLIPCVTHALTSKGHDASEDGTGRETPLVEFDTTEHQPQMGSKWRVRRITPMEAERLQGFPDCYTNITFRNKPAADGPRYAALGNSMAVPVVRWIGQRIQFVDRIRSGVSA